MARRGEVLQDRYLIEDDLDQGGMGTIFLARDLRLDRKVVVKIPRSDLTGDIKLRERFLAEVRDLSLHEHPHILSIQDFGEFEGSPFAVLQYLAGGNLSQRIAQSGGVQTVREVLEWLRPIAAALDFIHSKGCLHRDIKPANIIFDEAGHPFLSDFGISTAMDMLDSESPTVEVKEQLTVQGGFVGSPAYAPPEAVDRIFTPAYDQYSLATVVYVALCGELPFEGKTAEAILIAKASTLAMPLPSGSLKEKVSPRVSKALSRALSKSPQDRYPSCQTFAEELARAAGVDAPAAPRRPIGRLLLATVGVAVVAVGYLTWDHLSASSRSSSFDGAPAPEPATAKVAPDAAGAVAIAAAAEVELGSTPAERAAALALCQRHYEHCSPQDFEGEDPRTYVPIDLEVDRFEVNNERFSAYVQENRITTLAEERRRSRSGFAEVTGLSWRRPSRDVLARDHPRFPVVHVSYDEAEAFCRHAGGRLPSEDEWEYAARGRERRVFPWGDEWDATRLGWDRAGGDFLEDVGSHPDASTPTGLEDMAGSVWEWTSSEREGKRVIKGGSFVWRNPAYFRGAAFSLEAQDETAIDIGFRCVTPR